MSPIKGEPERNSHNDAIAKDKRRGRQPAADRSSPDIADPAKYWREMYYDLLKRVDAGEFNGEAARAIKPLPGELALIQIALESLRHISGYAPASNIQPVLIARDALKKIAELKFESESVANLAADQTAKWHSPSGDAAQTAWKPDRDAIYRAIESNVRSEPDKHFIDRRWMVGINDAVDAILAISSTDRPTVPPGHELCSSCGRLFKWGETCSRGGCPCGGDV